MPRKPRLHPAVKGVKFTPAARPADVLVQSDTHGQPSTVYTFTFVNEDALAWARENIQAEQSWLGVKTLVVEHRYVELLAEGLREAGYVVR